MDQLIAYRKYLKLTQQDIADATGIKNDTISTRKVPMTAFEIISIFIGVLALLMSFGSLLIALLAFLDKRNERK